MVPAPSGDVAVFLMVLHPVSPIHRHNMLAAAMLLCKMWLIFFAPAAGLGTAALLDFKGRLYRE
jgi:hypothetical protein